MELHKEIQITNTPAIVDVNFEALKQSLEGELKKYEIVVTPDTVGDAKKLATELNKTKKVIDDRRKEEVAKASEPVKRFDEQMKELVIMCEKGRKDILNQVERFEHETKELCKDLLGKARDWLFEKYEVEPSFHRAEFDDLVKISNVTDKGNLTKAVKQTLESRVRDDRALQDKIVRRMLELENQCYKAGLEAPLTQEHVKAFLFADEETYQRELQALIAKELERQQETERRLRSQMEKEQERKDAEAEAEAEKERHRIDYYQSMVHHIKACGMGFIGDQMQPLPLLLRELEEKIVIDDSWGEFKAEAIAARDEALNRIKAHMDAGAKEQKPEPSNEAPKPNTAPEPAPTPQPETSRPKRVKGKVTYTVTSEFKIEAPAGLRESDIDAEFRRIIAKAGAEKSLVAVYVQRQEQESAA